MAVDKFWNKCLQVGQSVGLMKTRRAEAVAPVSTEVSTAPTRPQELTPSSRVRRCSFLVFAPSSDLIYAASCSAAEIE
ncbi:hypothetical protein PBY51_004501 [Eleginops maclovinus]|uniref:Uncharacterized protein n=1 Tax=Eleginops maclovinus TaxID=56733 RepID=A0AAN8AWD4_ELEMC|nr:hypothetical protein PBY51_004501 [Eleginops maclovinus]